MKKKIPSIAKAIPKAAPKRSMKCGQSRPNSKLSTVPVTAPTAKVIAIAFDQRRGRPHPAPPAAFEPDVVGDQDHRRQRYPEAGENDVEGEGEGHLLAGGEQIRRRRCQ